MKDSYNSKVSSLIESIKVIKRDKQTLYLEGRPLFILSGKKDKYFYFVSIRNKEEPCFKSFILPGVLDTTMLNLKQGIFYYYLFGYKPHVQLLKKYIYNLRTQYHLSFNTELTYKTLIFELSNFLSEKVIKTDGRLSLAVSSFFFLEQNDGKIKVIEPDGSILDKKFFITGSITREELSISLKELKEDKDIINKVIEEFNKLKEQSQITQVISLDIEKNVFSEGFVDDSI